ncbi:lipoxygenase homology domain-containing protein 1-like, partial [Seriola aureovittata]|uniref:lipoxygenase homology domain-containing protein 1-like n=1 Tax=Seriola aureovittata TaxID=2871759 RepID=UPI0024BE2C70
FPRLFFFRWLDRNEDDGQIVRELVPDGDGLRLFNVSYHIAIKTGNVNGASSDSKVFVKLYGEKCDTNKMILAVSDNDLRNYFETGRTDIFTIDTFDIGKASSLDMQTLNREQSLWFRHIFVFSNSILFYSLMSSVLTDQPSPDRSHQRGPAGRMVSGQCADLCASSRDAVHVPEPPLALQR